MRSYSSLLCHILGSHDQITGYAELKGGYQSRRDLVRMRVRAMDTNDGRLEGDYVLDKVLFDRFDIAASVLRRSDVHTIFSIREPDATIRSTVAMAGGPDRADRNWKADVVKVGEYYVARAGGLVQLAERRPAHSVFFVADRLIDRTDETLSMLTSSLGLESPLSSSYQRFTHTRRRGFGDPSRYITTGEIVPERRRHDVEVPDSVLRPAREAYEDAVARLTDLCATTLPDDHA